MSTQLHRELVDELEKLAPEERVQVLRYMRSLKADGVPGATLLKYVGLIPQDDLRRMAAAIEEDFERVDGAVVNCCSTRTSSSTSSAETKSSGD